MTILTAAFLAFLLGTALGGAICFHITADTYESALDESYRETLDLRRQVSKYEDLIEKMKPVHCPTKQSKVSKIVTIDWEELDFPNSEVNHE